MGAASVVLPSADHAPLTALLNAVEADAAHDTGALSWCTVSMQSRGSCAPVD